MNCYCRQCGKIPWPTIVPGLFKRVWPHCSLASFEVRIHNPLVCFVTCTLLITFIIYHQPVPADEIDKEDLGIVFDTENLDAPSKSTQAEDGENQETEEETDSKPPEEDADSKSPEEDADSKPPKEDAESKASEENVEEEEMLCSLMLEKKLIELYTNAVDPSTTDLLLCLKPLSSKLENVFSVIFTREAVEEDSSLAEAGRKMRYESRVTRNPMEVSRMLKDLDDKQKPIALFTIMADVSIQCLETFAVKDKSTGTIVSGSTDPQEVTHLVRFEVTTDLDGGRHLGSWRIVDWDDLLEGNVWY